MFPHGFSTSFDEAPVAAVVSTVVWRSYCLSLGGAHQPMPSAGGYRGVTGNWRQNLHHKAASFKGLLKVLLSFSFHARSGVVRREKSSGESYDMLLKCYDKH